MASTNTTALVGDTVESRGSSDQRLRPGSAPRKPPKASSTPAKQQNQPAASDPSQSPSSAAGTGAGSGAGAGQGAGAKKKRKKKERKKTFCVDSTDENAVIRHLLSERVYGYPRTYGGRLSNFRYYVQYNHPLLSIYFVHPLHPFSRKQRLIVYLCSMSFSVCFAFILLATPLVPVIATCSSVCNCQVQTDDAAQQVQVAQGLGSWAGELVEAATAHCVGGYNDGRECDAYSAVCRNYQSWMLSCICGAATVLYDALLRFLATCSCLQGKKRFQNNCLGVRFKALVEYFGSLTLLFCSVLSLAFVLLTMVLCWYEGIAAKVLVTMVLAEFWSTGQWVVWPGLPWFLYQYRADRKTFYEKLKRKSERLSARGEGGEVEMV